MKKIIKTLIFTICIWSIFCLSTIKLKAAYNYGPDGVVSSAQAIVSNAVIDSSNLVNVDGDKVSDYKFGELSDIAVYEDKVYVSDKSNNCIVILDENLNYIKSFPDANSSVTLNSPRGLYVTKDYIYVCDFSNNRVLLFNHNLEVMQIVSTPDDLAFKDYQFRPKKITVNRTGRMYVIAEGINEGIIDFNPDGTFSRYYGMNTATLSAWDAFWLLFTSEEQRLNQGYNFGAALTNLCIDDSEYVYTVSAPVAGTDPIKRLNFKGSDILIRNGYVDQNGDQILTEYESVPVGESTFVDIDVNDFGNYMVLDKTRGRIFTYDFEGNLLYIGGGLSNAITGENNNQSCLFQSPEALCYFQDKILVIDSKNKNIVSFEYTNFGKLVNEATQLYYYNDYDNASRVWEEILEINTNYYLAYSGIGKAQFRQGQYELAMKNLKLGYDTYNYSRAYQQYRYEKMSVVFPYIIGIGLAACVFMFVKSFRSNSKRQEREEEGLE